MRLRFVLAFAALLLVACGSSNSGSSAQSTTPALSSLPATLEGEFAAVGGGIESDGSEFFLGGLTVDGEDVSVKVSKAIVDSSGLPYTDALPSSDGRKVRATLSSKIDILGEPMYVISALQRL